MKSLKMLAPLGVVALACLPCLALGLAVVGGSLVGAAEAFLRPTVAIPAAGFGLALLGAGGYRLRHHRRCGRLASHQDVRGHPALRSDEK